MSEKDQRQAAFVIDVFGLALVRSDFFTRGLYCLPLPVTVSAWGLGG